jgi:hypothetical protein
MFLRDLTGCGCTRKLDSGAASAASTADDDCLGMRAQLESCVSL